MMLFFLIFIHNFVFAGEEAYDNFSTRYTHAVVHMTYDCAQDIESKVDVISNELKSEWDITQSLIIKKPGNYVLKQPLYGKPPLIKIIGANVTLDLNGHTLQALGDCILFDQILPCANITIKNGILQGDFTGNGITIPRLRSVGITLENIRIRNFRIGINIQDASQIRIKNCVIADNLMNMQMSDSSDIFMQECSCDFAQNTYGIYVVNCTTMAINRCSFNFNDQYGMYASRVSNTVFTHCLFNNNGPYTAGVSGCRFEKSSDVNFANCFFNRTDKASQLFGIQISGSFRCKLDNCTANGNKEAGFDVDTSQDILFDGCAAMGDGANQKQGFRCAQLCENIIFSDCRANNNSDAGFSIVDTAGLVLNFCSSQDNVNDGFYLKNCHGLVQHCSALFNKTSSGFETWSNSATLVFLSNRAQGNGFNPADGKANKDTNYMIAASPTPFPKTIPPYNQIAPNLAVSIYSNISMP